MKIWIISDTHTYHYKLIPPSDIDMVIHSGDCSNSHNPLINSNEVEIFMDWYNKLPVKHKIYVPGNHDTSIERGLINTSRFNNIKFLFHESLNIEGINFFGSPYTPRYGDWSYMYQRSKSDKYWRVIPENTDFLITHGPPKSILDLADDINDRSKPTQVGCSNLYKRVMKIKPKYHSFGHIHSVSSKFNNYGIFKHFDTTFINAACLNHGDATVYNGHVVYV